MPNTRDLGRRDANHGDTEAAEFEQVLPRAHGERPLANVNRDRQTHDPPDLRVSVVHLSSISSSEPGCTLQERTGGKRESAAGRSVTPILDVATLRAEELAEVEVVVADFDAPHVVTTIDALRSVLPGLPTLAWTRRVSIIDKGLESMAFGRYEVVDRASRTPLLIEAVRRLVSA